MVQAGRISGILIATSQYFTILFEIFHYFVADSAMSCFRSTWPGRVAQSVGHLTRKSGGSVPGLATYFRFSSHFFKKGSCQLLTKVCARSTG